MYYYACVYDLMMECIEKDLAAWTRCFCYLGRVGLLATSLDIFFNILIIPTHIERQLARRNLG